MKVPKPVSTLAFLLAPALAISQHVFDPMTLPCNGDSAHVQVTPLFSDSLSSSFHICIPREVKPHLHRYHTEHVLVLEGEGSMLLGDSTFSIGAGHVIIIPMGTRHAVRTTSDVPLRVISVQAPFFDGSDRVMIEP
ncbi:MAG: cupin domain-containing protein [Flavobacteriales bacterium]|nr:cupin domain-containing protein [Flavobacteriales bacterium]